MLDLSAIKYLLSAVVFLLYVIYSISTYKRHITSFFKMINTWILRFSKPKITNKISISDIINKREVTVTVLDEMIGYFESSHIGIYVFHNGSVSINGLHLYKLSMIDERSRYYSIVMSNQNLPASLFIDIVHEIKEKGFIEINKLTTNISWLKESLLPLSNINYMYYTIQFDKDVPEYVISIATIKPLNQEQIDKLINYYNPLLNQIYSNRLENNFYESLKRNEI